MKKQSFMIFSFAAICAISPFALKQLDSDSFSLKRHPASAEVETFAIADHSIVEIHPIAESKIEVKELEKLPEVAEAFPVHLSTVEAKELEKLPEVAQAFPIHLSKVEAKEIEKLKIELEDIKEEKAEIAQCIKDDKASKLEEQIKELVADKAKILNELEGLRKEKAPKEVIAKKPEMKAPAEDMSQMQLVSMLTSFMISQQQQQTMLMQQMFTMMNNQSQARPQSNFSIIPEEFKSPFAQSYSQFDQPMRQHSPLSFFDHSNIGLRSSSSYFDMQNPYMSMGQAHQSMRAPSQAQYDMRAYGENRMQPQIHNGFDFLSSMNNDQFTRMSI